MDEEDVSCHHQDETDFVKVKKGSGWIPKTQFS